jgi:hypothetical protein
LFRTIFYILIISFLFFFSPLISNVSAQVCTDNDNDGFAVEGGACGEPDCDDNDANVNPGAVFEVCDGKDTDCDGWKPPNDVDADGDGYAVCAGDCDDTSTLTYPGASEQCDGRDNDCNRVLPLDERDIDNDGYSGCAGDCNDFDPLINPELPEICGDNKDNNCSSGVDEAGCVCPDFDGDGHTAADCSGTDCDDSNAAVNPDAEEECNDGIDNDCDGLIDSIDPDAVSCVACSDADGDGYYVEGGFCGSVDCDDSDPNVYPGALEICDGVDSNCNTIIPDEEMDVDGDGYMSCGFETDCDDYDASVNPGAFEVCSDGIDNNCNGLTDFDDQEFCIDNCVDGDLDGYKDIACGGSDCDDKNARIFPTDIAICDGSLSDCSGFINLTWSAPTANEDGSELNDLAGYILYYRTSYSYDYTESIDVGNITCHSITNLPQGTFHFVLTAYDTSGNESDFSEERSIDVEK